MADTAYQPTPWLDTMLNEEHLLEGLVGICENNGWTKIREFTKVAYSNKLTKPTIRRLYLPLASPVVDLPELLNNDYFIYLDGRIMPFSYYTETENANGTTRITFEPGVSGQCTIYYSSVQADDTFDFYVAKHHILMNASGNIFGMAMLAKVTEQIGNTECRVPFAIYEPLADFGTELTPQSTDIFSWAIQKAEEDRLYETHTLYFYQLDKFIGTGKMLVGWDNPAELKRLALDAEIQTSMWGLNSQTKALQFKITHKFPQLYQSPITVARTRIPQLEHTEKFAFADVKYTNWWEDSKVFLKGFIDGKSLMFIIHADTAPIWDSNAVPAIPLYMGDFDMGDSVDEVVNREIKFDFSGATTRSSTIISNKPMVNYRSKVKVWLMGDADGGRQDEFVRLTIAGQTIGHFTTTATVEPTNNREDAEYMGEFDITNIDGKSAVTIEAYSDAGVSAYFPVAARMWLEFTIQTESSDDMAPAALFAGTAYHKEGAALEASLKRSAELDYDDVQLKQEILQPIMKDYTSYPSNGIDSVMVKRTKYGARYQAHYLSWNIPSNVMPPSREDQDGKKHPRAWNNYENDVYKYQFNPSRYSDKAHSSRALLIHPEDGTYGTLRNVILVSPLSIMNGDELKAVKNHCDVENKYEVYAYYLVEGISPLTKRSATGFRPAGLGILKGGYTLPEIPPPPPPPPAFTATINPGISVIDEGDSIKISSLYSRHSPIAYYQWTVSSDVHKGDYTVNDAEYTFHHAGQYTVTFKIWNEREQHAAVTATVLVKAKPVPPPPPPPPPSGTMQCGHMNDSGGGVLTEKFHEMGARAGNVRIDYSMEVVPDRIDVYYRDQLVASSNNYVSGSGSLHFAYSPVAGITQIKVVMKSQSEGTSWSYTVHCPV
ncbi:PKD domain-containing protein [Paenibacillus algorifonticola]|uniref:PKD domain-containing protein n=1 Tax=Paenibacillus algorifonticola TaxID=684063 RepID=UPI003D2E26EE